LRRVFARWSSLPRDSIARKSIGARERGSGKNFARTQKIVDGKIAQPYISHLKGGNSAMAKKAKKTTKKSAKKSTKKKK